MNVQELTARIVAIFSDGAEKSPPIHLDYEDTSYSKREKSFVIIGLSGVKITDEMERQRYIATYSVAFYVDPASSGAKLLGLAHSFFHPRLYASELNVAGLNAAAISYNAKLDKLEYVFTLSISCTLSGDALSPIKSGKSGAVSFPLDKDNILKAESFSLSRARAFSEVPTICTGTFLGDGGNKGATLSLKGILRNKEDVPLLGGAVIALLEGYMVTPIVSEFLGLQLPAMRLKSYSISGSDKEPVCELNLVSASPAEVIGVG